MNLKNVFQSIGMLPEEAEILAILYSSSNAKVSEITRKTSIPRTSIYIYLKNLEKRGYIVKSKKGKIASFVPKNPELILENLDTTTTQFATALPLLLNSMERHEKHPKITFYESQTGIENIYKDMVRSSKSKEIVYVIESAETIRENLERLSDHFMLRWQKQMVEKNILTQGIVTGDAKKIFAGLDYRLRNVLRNRAATVRLQSSQDFGFSMNLYLVGGEKVYFFVPQKKFVMKIESVEIYQSLLTLYKVFYETATPIQLTELLAHKS